jgi:hypothetical protein
VTISSWVTDKAQSAVVAGAQYEVEDWWDRLSGGTSWMFSNGNMACLHYALRSALAGLPPDDEVLYGHINNLGHLVHVTEVEISE